MSKRGDILDTEFEGKQAKEADTRIFAGDDLNLTNKDPALKKIMVGCGWDLNTFQGEEMDLDVSVFLLNSKDQTREDGDFIFYNNMKGCNDAVIHRGDSRTGAGDGDDENISIDLLGLPFDILRIVIAVSVYQGYEKDQPLSRIKNAYVRLTNAENGIELARFELHEDLKEHDQEFAMIAAYIDREGPKWHFKPVTEYYKGGLAEIATQFGIIIMRQ